MSSTTFNKVLGIDLGTTNSCLAVMEGKNPVVITTVDGHRTIPSIVAYTDSGDILVGLPAKNQAVINSKNTISAAKRIIGKSINDKEVVKYMAHSPNTIKGAGADNTQPVFVVNDKMKYPEEISANILIKIKEAAANYYGFDPVKTNVKAVITVPAYFNNPEREATKEAAKIAGLDVIRIINEPTAAAIAYTYGRNFTQEKTYMAVYDLGGGTFDISIVEIEKHDDGSVSVEVKSTGGDTYLGGEDIDIALFNYIVDDIQKKHPEINTKDPLVVQRVKAEAEKAKRDLSSMTNASIMIPYIYRDISYSIDISRAKLNELSRDIIDRTIKTCKEVMKEAGLSISDINDVILVGGMTRMPAVRDAVKGYFGKEPKTDLNPDEIVACGAAIQGAQIQGDVTDILLIDVTPLSLGIETMGGVFTPLIKRNTSIPTQASQVFSTAEDGQSQVVIKVYQGERSVAADNRLLGNFSLSIPPAPRGVPKIEVAFKIDSNGIVNVSAKDQGTGKEQSLVITECNSLSKEEQERLVREAEQNQERDQRRLKVLEVCNEADTRMYDAEKMIRENEEKIGADLVGQLRDKVETLKKLTEEVKSKDPQDDSVDTDELKTASDELNKVMMEAGRLMYQNNGGENDGSTNTGSESQSDSESE